MKTLFWAYMTSVGITLITYLWNHRRVRHGGIITAYLMIILFGSLFARYSEFIFGQSNNLFLFHILTPLEYSMLAFYYYRMASHQTLKKGILVSIPLFIVTSLALTAFYQKVDQNNSVAVTLESVLLIIWSLLFIRETIITQQHPRLQAYSAFWISSGLLFFFVGNLIVEGLLNYLMRESMEMAMSAYRFSFTFKFLLFAMLTTAALSDRMFKVRGEIH